MIDAIRSFFELFGACTTLLVIFFLVKFWWEKWGQFWFKFHKHSYQIYCISSMHHKERDCDTMQICLKCEKCNKRRNFSFWNDRIKIQAVPEQFDEYNETIKG